MSSDSPSPESSSGTLFDPPSNGTQDDLPRESTQRVVLDLPTSLVTELREVARHVGLSPKLFIARALAVVCSEIAADASSKCSERSISLSLAQYQSRLDILRAVSSEEKIPDDAFAPDAPSEDVEETASSDDASS